MVRKSLLIVLGLVVVLSFSSIAFAQEYWAWNKFTAEHERFKYEITSYSTHWDYDAEEDVFIETHQVQVMELRRRDMGIGMGWATGGGEWMGEFMILGLFGADLELEVGSSMQLFDGSKIRVVEKQTVAGVEGYLCTKSVRSEDEAGNRVDVLTSEWVIAPNVGWPLSVRVYDEGDQVKYVMELVEYARN